MSNDVRIQQLPQGQFTVTIPRALAGAMRIHKGDEMEWLLEGGRQVLVRVRKK